MCNWVTMLYSRKKKKYIYIYINDKKKQKNYQEKFAN